MDNNSSFNHHLIEVYRCYSRQPEHQIKRKITISSRITTPVQYSKINGFGRDSENNPSKELIKSLVYKAKEIESPNRAIQKKIPRETKIKFSELDLLNENRVACRFQFEGVKYQKYERPIIFYSLGIKKCSSNYHCKEKSRIITQLDLPSIPDISLKTPLPFSTKSTKRFLTRSPSPIFLALSNSGPISSQNRNPSSLQYKSIKERSPQVKSLKGSHQTAFSSKRLKKLKIIKKQIPLMFRPRATSPIKYKDVDWDRLSKINPG